MSIINPLAAASTIAPPPVNLQVREEKEQNLRRDQVIRAAVAEGGSDRVLLEVGNRSFWVETNLPLKTGQKLNLEVFEGPEGLELRPVFPDLGDRILQSLHLLGERFELLPLLDQLLQSRQLPLPRSLESTLEALQMLLTHDPEADAGVLFKHLGRILGLELEAGLNSGQIEEATTSLKGVLFQLAGRELANDPEIQRQAEHLLHLLEAFQFCRIKLFEDGNWLVPLPLPFLESGFLIAERHPQSPRDQEALEQSYRLTLHLKPEHLGCLKIDLLWQGQGLYLRIECARAETLASIQGQQQQLMDALQPMALKNLSFGSRAEEPANLLVHLVTRGRANALDERV